ncbi:MAG: tetratricopeptide repeat protein [Planctomycetes bacterium]|nr:tetratricopeptide repeat protein [Planctomycetota bacterium]
MKTVGVALTIALACGGLYLKYRRLSRRADPFGTREAGRLAEEGYALAAQGKFGEAERKFDQSIEEYAQDPSIFLARANARLKAGKPEGAIADCDHAHTLLANYPGCWRIRARADMALQRWSQAIVDVDRELTFQPDDQDSWTLRATAHEKMGDLKGAVGDCKQALMRAMTMGDQLMLAQQIDRLEATLRAQATPR